jgi:hypothetical protein
VPEAPPVQRGLPSSRCRRGYRDGGLTKIEGHSAAPCRWPLGILVVQMDDQDEFVRSLAEYHGHSEEDAFAARDFLRLSPEDFVVRFSEVARFARMFGLNIRSLAEFVAETGTGIEPWQPSYELTREEYERIREAEERLARGGDWAHTILTLLDEVERLRGQRSSGRRDGDDVAS